MLAGSVIVTFFFTYKWHWHESYSLDASGGSDKMIVCVCVSYLGPSPPLSVLPRASVDFRAGLWNGVQDWGHVCVDKFSLYKDNYSQIRAQPLKCSSSCTDNTP